MQYGIGCREHMLKKGGAAVINRDFAYSFLQAKPASTTDKCPATAYFSIGTRICHNTIVGHLWVHIIYKECITDAIGTLRIKVRYIEVTFFQHCATRQRHILHCTGIESTHFWYPKVRFGQLTARKYALSSVGIFWNMLRTGKKKKKNSTWLLANRHTEVLHPTLKGRGKKENKW